MIEPPVHQDTLALRRMAIKLANLEMEHARVEAGVEQLQSLVPLVELGSLGLTEEDREVLGAILARIQTLL